jgi:hypothetical protein
VTVFIEQANDHTVETRVVGIRPGSLTPPPGAVVTRLLITKDA